MSETTTPGVRKAMPILTGNGGVGEGVYRYYDAKTGKLIDEVFVNRDCQN